MNLKAEHLVNRRSQLTDTMTMLIGSLIMRALLSTTQALAVITLLCNLQKVNLSIV